MLRHNRFFAAILACMGTGLMGLPANAQEITTNTELSRSTVRVGYSVSLTLEISGVKPDAFHKPALPDGLRYYGSPATGKRFSMGFGQGAQYVFTKTYTILAEKPGEYTIPAGTAEVGGRELPFQAKTLTVSEKSQEQKRLLQELREKVFLKAEVTNTNPYKGEQVRIQYKLYYQDRVGEYRIKHLPDLGPFWVETISDEKNIKHGKTRINGHTFQTATFWDKIVFPQQAGQFEIAPMKMKIEVGYYQKVYDAFSRSTYQQLKYYPLVVETKPVVLQVKPLPSPQPGDFSGIVGKVRFEVSLSDSQVQVNDAVTFSIGLYGEGNLKLYHHQQPAFPSDVEVHVAQTTEQYQKKNGVFTGTRFYEYALIPNYHGEYKIPQTSLSYFNVESETYESFNFNDLSLKVGAGNESKPSSQYSSQHSVGEMSRDIRYIHEHVLQLQPKGQTWFGSAQHVALASAPLALLLLAAFYRKKKEQQGKNPSFTHKKELQLAKRKWEAAEAAANQENGKQCSSLLLEGWAQFFKHQYGVAIAELNTETLQEKMQNAGVQPSLVQKVIAHWNTLGMAQYAPQAQVDGIALCQQTRTLFSALHQNVSPPS